MWYALQLFITFGTAYIWLTEISDQKDVGHAIWLGVVLAFYATIIVSGALNAISRLIRAFKAMLLCGASQLSTFRAHKKPDQFLLSRGSGGRSRSPRLIP